MSHQLAMKRVVLGDDTDRDAIDDAMQLAGLRLANVAAASAAQPAQVVAVSSDRSTLVHFVWDARLDVVYAVIAGAGVEAVERDLRAALPTYSDADAAAMTSDPADAPRFARGVVLLALTAPAQATRGALELFAAARAHPDAAVRRAAELARAYVSWPELAALPGPSP
jgi:hypothetical protein